MSVYDAWERAPEPPRELDLAARIAAIRAAADPPPVEGAAKPKRLSKQAAGGSWT